MAPVKLFHGIFLYYVFFLQIGCSTVIESAVVAVATCDRIRTGCILIPFMKAGRKRVHKPGQRVTLKFLANYLELSPTTVSFVLTDSPLASTIAKGTKARIWEAAQKFQYRPNLFARYLQAKRTYSIAVLVPEIGDEFSAMLISGIEATLAAAQFNYFVESHGFAPQEVENYPDLLLDRQVEGMIFINTPLRKPKIGRAS